MASTNEVDGSEKKAVDEQKKDQQETQQKDSEQTQGQAQANDADENISKEKKTEDEVAEGEETKVESKEDATTEETAGTSKRPADDSGDDSGEKDEEGSDNSKASEKEKQEGEGDKPPAVKRAKIAMPPAIAPNLMNVDEYQIDDSTDNDADEKQKKQNDDDVVTKITNPSLILFGLHPLIREPPLRKTLEKYGKVETITVRSAFASRYGSVTYASTEEAQAAYKALNGFSIFHKKLLVQPGQPSQSS